MNFAHEPVLLRQVVEWLNPAAGRRFIDGTVGGGGHSAAILEKAPADAELLGIDRDDEALAAAKAKLSAFGPRVRLVRSAYSRMSEIAEELEWEDGSVDGILLDIGVSSHQINTPDRGFAHRFDGPLDMRMDRRTPVTAATLLNRSTLEELTRIFREYGEEPKAFRLAQAIVARRAERPWERTGELAELAQKTVGKPFERGLPAATRCFQALRIAVNGELEELEKGLEEAVLLLRPGGRLAVISFHSLEDRRVKHFFRDEALSCVCPPGLPICVCHKTPRLKVLTKHPVDADEAEVAENRRSACAHLRVAERV